MIKNYNNKQLCIMDVDSSYYLFCQVWKELTEKRTMDSYQFRVMNSLNALTELIEVINARLNRHHSTNHNVDDCKAETANLIKHDTIISKYYRAIWISLLSNLNKKTESDAQLRSLRYQLTYCYNILVSEYMQKLFSELESDILQHNTIHIIEKTKKLLSCCSSKGWSTNALYHLVDILNGSKHDQDKWNQFKNRLINATEDIYLVYIPITLTSIIKGVPKKGIASKIHSEITSIGNTRINIFERADLLDKYSLNYSTLTDKEYMEFKVEAYDFYSASHLAIDRCSDVLNVLSFYNYIEPWEYQSVTLFLVNSRNQKYWRITGKQLYVSFNYLDSNSRVFKASKRIFQKMTSPVTKKLQASFAYANMGKASGTQEEKFMNTWVALESLCRGTGYDNIISNVLETVPPALCTRYIYRHFRNFIEDCYRCGVELTFVGTDFSFTDKRPKSEHVKDIIKFLKDPVLYSELLIKCQVNDLLLQRCTEMHELAIDSQNMFQRIFDHYDTVRKQLSRLYRLRNNIAHTGMTSTSIIRYIEHLEDYLNGFVAEIVMCADINKEYTPEIIFEMIKDNFYAFSDLAKTTKQADVSKVLGMLLDTGIIELTYKMEG